MTKAPKVPKAVEIVPPQVGGSYLLNEATGVYTPLEVPEAPAAAVHEAPDPVDPEAVKIVPPQVGGSYLLDETTGDHAALFVPESGTDGDGVPLDAAGVATTDTDPPAAAIADPAQD